MRRWQWLAILALVMGFVAGSFGPSTAQTDDVSMLVSGNNAFAFELYHAVSDSGDNLILSPYSISSALAMTYAGARGNTEQQMADTLNFTLPQEQLHPAFQALDLALTPAESTDPEEEPLQLNIANALWAQVDYDFLVDYVDLVAQYYEAGLQELDFETDPEGSRQTINDWVSEETEERITDLLAEGTITPDTRLVPTNAIYFKGGWLSKFDPEFTRDQPFYLLDGSEVTVPMMSQTIMFPYVDGEGYQAFSMPYAGGQAAMLVLLPDADNFEAFEESLTAEQFQTVLDSVMPVELMLSMPRFEYESGFELDDTLISLGMSDAFDPDNADFSGMTGGPDLFISAVIHKAFVKLDESGTEAAAATAVIMAPTAAQENTPVPVVVDRPFLYVIYDQTTGSILFIGRVLNPAS